MKKLQNITNRLYPVIPIIAILLIWQGVILFGIVPAFLLPSPANVLEALITDKQLLLSHLFYTLAEAFIGLGLSIIFAFITAILMDEYEVLHKLFYPLIIITQTVPTIAIAPLLVLWLGYGLTPKITLVFITCFFPLLISIYTGIKSADNDTLNLFRSMGANKIDILTKVKLPYALDSFFSGLRVSTTYAIVGAVIAEWLGGNMGLGVYMTRVRKAYAFDKMFAVIFIITILSLVAIFVVGIIEKKSMPWKFLNKEEK